MRKLTATEKALIAQLTENTGMSMLDSGGAYGRHWEQNQGRTFIDEPATVLKFEKWGDCHSISITHNLFHWLNERVEYDPDMDRKFTRFAARKEFEDSRWPEIMKAFAKKHGGNDDSYGMVNTYGGDDCLSQIIQYHHWYNRAECREYIALQIHGGCDARGGYSSGKIYLVCGGLFDNARATIHCPHCRAMWDSDNGGYSWTPEEGSVDLSFLDNEKQGLLPLGIDKREPWPLLNLSEEGYFGKQEAYTPVAVDKFPDPMDRLRGNTYIANEQALCPYCLTGILEGSW